MLKVAVHKQAMRHKKWHYGDIISVSVSVAGADQWLSEATFLTGNGPGEAIDKVTDSPEEARIVKVSAYSAPLQWHSQTSSGKI